MCVPRIFYKDCLDLLEKSMGIECVAGRDRVDCLELIENNKADVVALEPEDIYYASTMNASNLRVIAEFRFDWSRNDEFEDEDVILIRKTLKINSFEDFKGLKSCHPGYDAPFGYKVFSFLTMPKLERELEAISEFFWHSCIPGTYSNDRIYDQDLKSRFLNLCKLCNNPIDCSNNDKYASYDGAINCLHDGYGDIAFTRMSSVKQFFNIKPENYIIFETGKNYMNEYEYFCEDGTRKPVNSSGCSLYKRPYRAYISNADIVNNKDLLNYLQTNLTRFFKNGLVNANVNVGKNLLIDNGMVLYQKYDDDVTPNEYISDFRYFMELNDIPSERIRLCMALTNNIRPKIECVFSSETDCFSTVANNEADIGIAPIYKWKNMEALPIKFNNSDVRARNAACALNILLKRTNCDNMTIENDVEYEEYIQVIISKDRHNYGTDKSLLCLNLMYDRLGNYIICQLEKYFQNDNTYGLHEYGIEEFYDIPDELYNLFEENFN
ncbi:transferrin-like [Condylostylus longicornis]|uniref:transferrin-like n=1 Tax=Condylostylus longicornis TaxID=2530218 RepID=UPI00244E1819|nr:transferrin-like [Condylostylus longicornis]